MLNLLKSLKEKRAKSVWKKKIFKINEVLEGKERKPSVSWETVSHLSGFDFATLQKNKGDAFPEQSTVPAPRLALLLLLKEVWPPSSRP